MRERPCRSCALKERSPCPARMKHLNSSGAAARSADFEAMHDAVVAYHQLLGIEEGEPDPRQALVSNERATHTVAASAVVGCRESGRDDRATRIARSRLEAKRAANGTGAALKCSSAAERSGRSI